MIRYLRELIACRKGATILEFALVAPVLIMLLFGLIDGGRMFWMKKTLDEVAFSTARCMSVSSTCDTTAKQQTYAVNRARGYGVRVLAANVTPTGATTCKQRANTNRVVVRATFVSGIGGFVPLPSTLRSTGCFPVVS